MFRKEQHPRRRKSRYRKREKWGLKERKRYRRIGISLQILLYLFNGIVWILAFFSFGFGLIVGLSSNTIGIGSHFSFLDFIITTPATMFFLYGVFLLIITFVGCFAAVSAKGCTNVIYCILIIMFIIYDIVIGLHLSYSPNAYRKYIERLNKSMAGYGDTNAKLIGIIPINPTAYWDQFQRKGRCCGLDSYMDWKTTPLGREKFSVPDSCCVLEYDHEGCGLLAWKHPDHGAHTFSSVWSERGCLKLFPEPVQKDDEHAIDGSGKALFAILLFCLVISMALITLVCNKRFKPSLGLTNPAFIETPDNPCLRTQTRVHPSTSFGEGDAEKEGVCSPSKKRVTFNDMAPCIICPHDNYDDERYCDINANNNDKMHG